MVDAPLRSSQRLLRTSKAPFRWYYLFHLVGALHNFGAIFLLALAWELLPRFEVFDAIFLPPLSAVLVALAELLWSGRMAEQAIPSLQRAAAGFSFAVVIGVPLGIVLGWYGPVYRFLSPLLELLRNTAALALLPVFILVLGIGETSKISIILYACIFPILLNTISGVRSVDPLLIRAAQSLALRPLDLFRKVMLPAALPMIFTGIRLAGASSILVLIAAEMVGANAGLGFYIFYAQSSFLIPQMYATILTMSVLGLTVNYTLLALERHFSRWRASSG